MEELMERFDRRFDGTAAAEIGYDGLPPTMPDIPGRHMLCGVAVSLYRLGPACRLAAWETESAEAPERPTGRRRHATRFF